MPLPSHQELISGFLAFKDKAGSLKDTLAETPLRDFKQKSNASFLEAKKLFLRLIKSTIEVQKENVPQWVGEYMASLNLSDEEWADLCKRDFGMMVDVKEAKASFQATFLTMMGLDWDLGEENLSSFRWAMEQQVLGYLKENSSLSTAKAGLSFIGPLKVKPEISSNEYSRIHQAILTMIVILRGVEDGSVKLDVVEKILNQNAESILHCVHGIGALNFVASNYRYLAEKRCFKNGLHKEAYLGWYAPVKGIEKNTESNDEVLVKAVKWNLRLLELTNDIHALIFLIYVGYQHSNSMAKNGLSEFFAKSSELNLYTREEILRSRLYSLLQEYGSITIQLRSAAPNIANCQSIEEMQKLLREWDALVVQHTQEQKQKIFTLISNYYFAEANSIRGERDEDKRYFEKKSGVPSAEELYRWLANFFENPELERKCFPETEECPTAIEFYKAVLEKIVTQDEKKTGAAASASEYLAGRSPVHSQVPVSVQQGGESSVAAVQPIVKAPHP